MDELVANNARYAASAEHRSLPTQPARRLAILTCMDSRIDVFASLGLRNGEAHVVRNAGGLATDDAVRSLVVSQRLLDTRSVMVIGHTRCGLIGLDEEEFAAGLERETGQPVPFAMGAFDDLDERVKA